MTRLISKSTRSSRLASTDGGTGTAAPCGELSIGVLAAVLTELPGRAGPRPPGTGEPSTGRRGPSPEPSVLHVPGRRGRTPETWGPRDRHDAKSPGRPRPHPCPRGVVAASLALASGSSPRGCPTP